MLTKLGEFIKKNYIFVLVLTGAFTILSYYWMTKLEVKTQATDMLPAQEPSVIAFKEILDNFKGIDTVSVVIEGKEEAILGYIEDVQKKLAKVNDVDRVMYKSEIEFLKKHGLLLLKDKDLKSLDDMLAASSLKDFIKGLNNNFEKTYIQDEDTKELSKNKQEMLAMMNTIEDFLLSLKNPKPEESEIKDLSNKFVIGPKYMISPDRTMGMIFVRTAIPVTDIGKLIPFVNELEQIVKANQAKHNVTAGVSGFLVLQRDEMAATTKDMKKSFFLALGLILIIFYFGFRLLRYSILAVIPLIVGIVWAMGLTYLIIGYLNLFTAMMGAILIGLGIDYAIHIISLYTEERHKSTPVDESVSLVFKKTVKAVITGSITTAIGFSMFGISSFLAFKELGITLGLGIICILVATILILPALFMAFGKKEVKPDKFHGSWMPFFEKTVLKRPKVIIAIFIVLTLISIYKFKDIHFSIDLKELEPKGLESIVLNEKLIEKFDFSNDQSLAVTSTLKETHILKEQAEDLDAISIVESIANYIPLEKDQNKRLKTLRIIQNQANTTADEKLYLLELAKELNRLEANLIEISDLAYMSGERKIVDKIDSLLNKKLIPSISDEITKYKGTISIVQKVFINNLKQLVLNTNSKRRITMKDLPKSITDSYIGKDGRFLTSIFPEGDVWSEKFQKIFFTALDSLDTPVTGTSVLSAGMMRISGEEGKKILILVVIVICLVLIIDFRSFKYASFAMLPMLLTLVLLIGLMSILKIPFDFVNIIGLPIIIGIGVDDGVHLIHRYRIEKKLRITIQSTGRAILLTTLTTIAAFGAMMTSTYRGFASFGLVLSLGIGFAYILTIFLLTSLLKVFDGVED